VVFVVILAARLQAYVDPGAGSIVLQVLLGGVAGLVVIGRVLWQRLTHVVEPQPADTDDGPAPTEFQQRDRT
jgi:hypothetical protein